MAIGPDKLKKKLLDESRAFETQIDDSLRNTPMNTNGQFIINIPNEMNVNHWNLLKPKYLELGWKDVEYGIAGSKIRFTMSLTDIAQENQNEDRLSKTDNA